MRNTYKGTLTDEQARHYRSQGYYKLPHVFTHDETAEMREFVAGEAAAKKDQAAKLGGKLFKMYQLYDANPELMRRVITNRHLTGPLASLLGPNIIFLKNRHNHATVNDIQGEAPEGLHRDILQPTRSILTAAVYLEVSTLENGATRLVPGSHELPYVGVPEDEGGGVWMNQHEEYAGLEDQAVSVPMPEGGVLLFNSLVFHAVGANTSGGSRMSMTLAFRAADELDANPDMTRQVIVAGEQTYRGNDRFF